MKEYRNQNIFERIQKIEKFKINRQEWMEIFVLQKSKIASIEKVNYKLFFKNVSGNL